MTIATLCTRPNHCLESQKQGLFPCPPPPYACMHICMQEGRIGPCISTYPAVGRCRWHKGLTQQRRVVSCRGPAGRRPPLTPTPTHAMQCNAMHPSCAIPPFIRLTCFSDRQEEREREIVPPWNFLVVQMGRGGWSGAKDKQSDRKAGRQAGQSERQCQAGRAISQKDTPADN